MEREKLKTKTRVILSHGVFARDVVENGSKRMKQSYYRQGVSKGNQLWGEDFFQMGLTGKVSRLNQKTCSVTFDDGRTLRQCEFWALDSEENADARDYTPVEGRMSWPCHVKG